MNKSYVYWIFYEGFSQDEGYVGVTRYPDRRIAHHLKNNPKVPSDAQHKILFEGTRDECFELEYKLRPRPQMGWNNAPGGSQGYKEGFKHSEETKKHLSEVWTEERRLAQAERTKANNKSLIGQKRPKQSAKMMGENNPMFGATHSDEARKKISESKKGVESSSKMQYFCIHCHKRASPHILKKYHGPGKKNCILE